MIHPKVIYFIQRKLGLKNTYCTLVLKASVHRVDGLTALACSIISYLAGLNIKNLILFLFEIVKGKCKTLLLK